MQALLLAAAVRASRAPTRNADKAVNAAAPTFPDRNPEPTAQRDIRSTAMSMFGSIMQSIFGSGQTAPAVSAAQALASSPDAQQGIKPGGAAAKVDVAGVLDRLADEADQELDWRRSIVDMMKLLKLDSSLAARKQLAKELKFAGDTKDTATMNIWLHKQVMTKFAENGGEVPAALKD
jgi:hypothetical protein